MAMDELKYTIIVKPEANTIDVRAFVVYIKRRKCSSKVFVDRNRSRSTLPSGLILPIFLPDCKVTITTLTQGKIFLLAGTYFQIPSFTGLTRQN